jgi:hypothetical protein
VSRYTALVLVLTAASAWAAAPEAADLVRRSVENNERNWKAAPAYTYTESDVITKSGKTSRRKYRVLMIDGSPYNELIAENNEPLTGARAAAEQKKLEQETARRKAESPAARARRVAQYQRERRQDHALMAEMVKAFDFKIASRERVNGRDCWVLDATPRPGYRPINRDTRVLTGMRGRMWVDAQEYQWVKVHAEVFRPVAFGLFIAHVQPGTEFTLEETPVGSGIWMPSRLITKVRATALVFWSQNSVDDETYTDYRRGDAPSQRASAR